MNELEKRSKVHRKKQKGLSPFCSLDAGNVEHNISMFNSMSNPAESPSTNPCGPMAESVMDRYIYFENIDLLDKDLESCISNKYESKYMVKPTINRIDPQPYNEEDMEQSFIVSSSEGSFWVVVHCNREEAKHINPMLNEDYSNDETVELFYDDLNIETTIASSSPYFDSSFGNWLPGDYDYVDKTIEYVYEVSVDDVKEVLADYVENEIGKEAADKYDFDGWNDFVDDYLDKHFDDMLDKYMDKVLGHFREFAKRNAEENYLNESFDDLEDGEKVFMEEYNMDTKVEYKKEPRMGDYFKQMDSEDDQ